MTRADRRKVLQFAMAASLAPALFARGAAAQEGLPTGSLISPPAGPMLYRRELTRELVAGAKIVTRRDFAIGFERLSDGFLVRGEQVAVDVALPETLARFAALEKARDESGLFPLSLDAFGRLRGDSGAPAPDDAIESAIALAKQRIEQQDLQRDEERELQAFVAGFHQAAAQMTAQIPTDLFAPARPLQEDGRVIALPTGEEGHFTNRFQSERDPATGLMRHASREILTEIGGDTRRTLERFWLMPA